MKKLIKKIVLSTIIVSSITGSLMLGHQIAPDIKNFSDKAEKFMSENNKVKITMQKEINKVMEGIVRTLTGDDYQIKVDTPEVENDSPQNQHLKPDVGGSELLKACESFTCEI